MPRGEGLALAGAGGREIGTGWRSGDGFGVGNELERGVPQIEQDNGLFSLSMTGSKVGEQCAAQTFARRNSVRQL